jgi:hypothetical protein
MSDMSKQEEARLMAEAVKLVQTIPGLEPLVLDSALAEMDVEAVLNLPKDLYDEVMQNPANLRHVIDLYKVKAHSLTKESIPGMTQDHLNRLLELKEPRSIVNKILFQPTDPQRVIPEPVVEVVDPEVAAQDAQAEADRVAAEAETVRIEAERVAAEAETVRLAAEAETLRVAAEAEAAKVVAPKTKIIREYQAVDGRGNPVGKPTHLEADSPEEMMDKMQAAHMSAAAAFERLKNKKTIEAAERAPASIPIPTDAELLEVVKSLDTEKDPVKKLESIKKIASVETQKAINQANETTWKAQRQVEMIAFLNAHTHDYYNCEANTKLIVEYIDGHKLRWTKANMELAMQEVESKLAEKPSVITPRTEPVVEKIVEKIQQVTPAANPPVAPATVVAPVIAPVATAVAPTPVAQAPAANIPAVAPKIPASGLEPGSLHGGRPAAGSSKTTGLTMQDVDKADRKQFQKWTKDPVYRAQLIKLGIKL